MFLKEKLLKLFLVISVLIVVNVFFALCVSADEYVEEICFAKTNSETGELEYFNDGILVSVTTEEYDLKDNIVLVTNESSNSDNSILRDSLRFYNYDRDVLTINPITGKFVPKECGQATIMVTCQSCTEFICINVCHPLIGGEIELNNKTYRIWEKKQNFEEANCYIYALNATNIDYDSVEGNNIGEIGGISKQSVDVSKQADDTYQTVYETNINKIIEAMNFDINFLMGNKDFDDFAVKLIDINSNFTQNVDEDFYNTDELSINYSYRIALFRNVSTSEYGAMHWMRQNADGTWSHKLGYSRPVSNLDAKGNVICSPSTCDMDYTNTNDYKYNYEYVATFLIKTGNTEN